MSLGNKADSSEIIAMLVIAAAVFAYLVIAAPGLRLCWELHRSANGDRKAHDKPETSTTGTTE
jgi:hypothetical protein